MLCNCGLHKFLESPCRNECSAASVACLSVFVKWRSENGGWGPITHNRMPPVTDTLHLTVRPTTGMLPNNHRLAINQLNSCKNLRYSLRLITVRNEVAKVMCLQASVCPQGEGVCLSACWDIPREQTPPRADPPRGADPPGETATAADSTHPTGMHSCSKFGSHLHLCT